MPRLRFLRHATPSPFRSAARPAQQNHGKTPVSRLLSLRAATPFPSCRDLSFGPATPSLPAATSVLSSPRFSFLTNFFFTFLRGKKQEFRNRPQSPAIRPATMTTPEHSKQRGGPSGSARQVTVAGKSVIVRATRAITTLIIATTTIAVRKNFEIKLPLSDYLLT